jgi:hypothetical protein
VKGNGVEADCIRGAFSGALGVKNLEFAYLASCIYMVL